MSSKSLICIWNVQDGSRRNGILYHKCSVQSLAFSRDDLYLMSVGGLNDVASCLNYKFIPNSIQVDVVRSYWGGIRSYLVCAGDFEESTVALWSTYSFELLCSISASVPLHEAAFCPSSASQLAYVGSGAVFFCYVQTRGRGAELQVCAL